MNISNRCLTVGDTIKKIYKSGTLTETPSHKKIHLFASRVEAGFPSPADDFLESALDLNEYLINHPAATFFVRVNGQSMIEAGINHNDILVVDRSLQPVHGSIVIAVINGELTVKMLEYRDNAPCLVPKNPDYQVVFISQEMDFSIWGVVTSVIHQFNK